jgi:chromate reductase
MSHGSTPFRVVALNGSLRKYSIQAGLIRETKVALNERASLSVLEIGRLPFFNADLEEDLPSSVSEFLASLDEADGIIIATPEYNMSFSGVLKNALEWASRPSLGTPMKTKPVALMGASPLTLGTSQAQSQLRQVLFAMQINLIQRPIVMIAMAGEKFDEKGNLYHEGTKSLVKQQMEALIHAMNIESKY